MNVRVASLLCCVAVVGCSKDFGRLQGGGLDAAPRDSGTADASIDDHDADPDDGGGDDRDVGADAGPDVAPDAAPDTCPVRRPPARPTTTDTASVPVRWYAMRRLRLGVGGTWREIGYDHDGRCTTADSAPEEIVCAPPPGYTPADDGPDGIDNAFGQSFVPLLVDIDRELPAELDLELENGEHGLLVRVAEWNGEANDPVVDVGLVDSPRGFAAGVDPLGPDPITPPAWDTTDEWWAGDRSFVSSDLNVPLARDTTAYVADGVLVARPRDGTEVNLSGNLTITLRINRAILTGRLSGTQLQGVILAGRVALDDIVDALPRLGYCPGTSTHNFIANSMARAADLALDDDAPPLLRCDAVSVGVGFDGVSARVTEIVPDRPIFDLCDGIDDMMLCSRECPTIDDGVCDDGGLHSERVTCELGTDCGDCAWRRG